MPSAPLPKLRAEVVALSRRLHANGWVANHDGNLSVRLHGDRLLITPTAYSKADVDDGSLLIVDLNGKVLEGRRSRSPSSSCTSLPTARALKSKWCCTRTR